MTFICFFANPRKQFGVPRGTPSEKIRYFIFWRNHRAELSSQFVSHRQEDHVVYTCMGWLRLVGSIKLQVSFAEYSLFYWALLHKRPIILSILLTEATPYHMVTVVLVLLEGHRGTLPDAKLASRLRKEIKADYTLGGKLDTSTHLVVNWI